MLKMFDATIQNARFVRTAETYAYVSDAVVACVEGTESACLFFFVPHAATRELLRQRKKISCGIPTPATLCAGELIAGKFLTCVARWELMVVSNFRRVAEQLNLYG